MRFFGLVLVALCLCSCIQTRGADGILEARDHRVVQVVDATHLIINLEGRRVTVRLAGIKIRPNQPHDRATQYLKDSAMNQKVTVRALRPQFDYQGRLQALIWHRGEMLNLELVRRGTHECDFEQMPVEHHQACRMLQTQSST